MKRMMRSAVLTTIFILLLSACAGQPDAVPDGGALPGAALEGTTWTLATMAKSRPLPGSEITAGFMNGQMSGSTGCNTYFYEYQTEGRLLLLQGGGVTEMACSQPEGVMEQESRFLDYLNQVETFQLSSDGLQLVTDEGEFLIFVPRS